MAPLGDGARGIAEAGIVDVEGLALGSDGELVGVAPVRHARIDTITADVETVHFIVVALVEVAAGEHRPRRRKHIATAHASGERTKSVRAQSGIEGEPGQARNGKSGAACRRTGVGVVADATFDESSDARTKRRLTLIQRVEETIDGSGYLGRWLGGLHGFELGTGGTVFAHEEVGTRNLRPGLRVVRFNRKNPFEREDRTGVLASIDRREAEQIVKFGFAGPLLLQRGEQVESAAALATLGLDELLCAIKRCILRRHDLAREKERNSGGQQQTAWHRSFHWSAVLTIGVVQTHG